ncbi:ImmA/IrrE family metallo-endopeptidase [uncultured Gordonia sp.]|uniref:helix-turn-helix domain-containing protein n=1 Tax=uncultured Gordonia sp. TaxID=198437 RepID=UPI00258BDDC0|nr:ImmA/IrrE family metallo-endopeptidase [uncultured Gordonia sp.]
MSEEMIIYGLRVRQARLMRRMTAKAVMDEVGWKGARLSRLERSETATITAAELEALARCVRFPEKFFITRPITRLEPEDLLFRAPKSTTEAEKKRMVDFISLSGDFLTALNDRRAMPPRRIKPDPDADPRDAAATMRSALGVKEDEPIARLIHSTERAGIPIVMRRERFGKNEVEENNQGRLEKHLGCSTWYGEWRENPIIVLRELDSWERTRWTVAHELGHLMLHTATMEWSESHEDEASRFASELLAPIKYLRKDITEPVTLLNLLPVKAKWGISVGALLRHLRDNEVLTEDDFERLRKNLYGRFNPDTGTTWGRTEPGWNDRSPERPRLMARWVEFACGVSSPGAAAAMYEILPADIIAEFLVGQRSAPKTGPTGPGGPGSGASEKVAREPGAVADFAAYQQRRA